MESNSIAEVRNKIYESRTNFWGRVVHFVGDSLIVKWPAGSLGTYLYHVTTLSIFQSPFYYMLVLLAYYFIMESLFQRTLFKILTGSIVVTENGEKPKPSVILVRSLIRLIPFEPISLLFIKENERWWHDVWPKTYVVKISKLRINLYRNEVGP